MASRDDLLVTLRANTRPMESNIRGSLRRITSQLDTFSARGTILLTAPLVAFGAFSVKAAADFEKKLVISLTPSLKIWLMKLVRGLMLMLKL